MTGQTNQRSSSQGWALVTGSHGLVGSEMTRFLLDKGMRVVGIDNDMRSYFFGEAASTRWNSSDLVANPDYLHQALDIRDTGAIERLFSEYSSSIELVVHTAAQPSHDWAAREPLTDFGVNALGTMNLLESCRKHSPGAVFIFTSTNKVYGDTPNRLPLVELETRYEVDQSNPYYQHGINETMSIDQSKHSIFGANKLAADIMVQEYGRYFGMNTGVFRGGCLTGPAHSGAELHGFLSYLVKCILAGKTYTIYGYKGKQVRDNIHARDLVEAFWAFYKDPDPGAVYNIGGGRFSNCSVLEAVTQIEEATGKKAAIQIGETERSGDHIWWVSDTRKFKTRYPEWDQKYSIRKIIDEMIGARMIASRIDH